ncbi:hypothetical protein DCC62_03890 [candidate division KSB1 bacterium]|nr:MAG: hypothetical protein DCC62_03890 [candidate division KSB1 bacterium]
MVAAPAGNFAVVSRRQRQHHLAFHPQNANTVIASAGTRNLRPNEVGQGGLLKNTLAGAGGPEDWEIIAGGPSVVGGGTFAGLPDAMIQAFVFDVKDDRRGVFVAARNRGIYYARINTDGTLDGSFNNGQFAKITDDDLDAVIPTSSAGGHHNYSRLIFDPDNMDHLYVARHWPSGGVFRIELVSNRTNLDPTNCIVQVDEVIRGRIIGNTIRSFSTDHASEVINLLVTDEHVFAGMTCGHLPSSQDSPGENYTGGLIQWAKNENPNPDQIEWIIGGENKLPSSDPTSMTMAIGGLAQDPISSNIIAATYRFSLRENNSADSDNPKLKGEDNYKLMNLWEITSNGQQLQVTRLSNSITQHQWPDAVTMAFFPNNPDKIIMPTHGNGIWIGTYNGPPRKVVMPAESAQNDPRLPERFALHHNYPNPFNPATVIKYDLPEAGETSIAIFDVLGRKVRTLVNKQQEAGYHAVTWNGKNDKGAFVGSGLYFCRMRANNLNFVRKLTLLR